MHSSGVLCLRTGFQYGNAAEIFTHPPSANNLTSATNSDTIGTCHARTKSSTLVILHRYLRFRRISGRRSRLKRTARRNTSSSPSSEAHGDRTVAASCRQYRRISRRMKRTPLRRSLSLDSGLVNSEALSKKMGSHFHYWSTRREMSSKVMECITG